MGKFDGKFAFVTDLAPIALTQMMSHQLYRPDCNAIAQLQWTALEFTHDSLVADLRDGARATTPSGINESLDMVVAKVSFNPAIDTLDTLTHNGRRSTDGIALNDQKQ
ncbi:MAG: hypothetical protein QOH96_1672 [Blastocatellia bacterium]|nr:hypothetical protein [Blastocatellia bacterium]